MNQKNHTSATRKKFLIGILEKLSGKWEVADGLLVLAQEAHVTDSLIDTIIELIQFAVKTVKEKGEHNNLLETLEKSADLLERVKQLELESKKKDDEELKALEDELESIY